MASPPATLRELLSRELPRLYAVAFQMCGSREEAQRFLGELCATASELGEAALLSDAAPDRRLLGYLARNLEENLGRRSEQTFDSLDAVLRSDITRPIDLDGPDLGNDPARVHLMLWELKRTCLISVLGCLPPGVRLSFVLTDLIGLSPAEAADLLGIKESAYRVRLTRARKRVEDYLAPRCYHVDKQNPCTCSGRLMIALNADFVHAPPAHEPIPHEAHDQGRSQRDVGNLYRALPTVTLSEGELRQLLARA